MYVEVFNAAQAYIHLEPIYLLIIIIIISYILSKTEEMQSKPVLAKILFVISIMIPITAFIYSVRDYNNLQKVLNINNFVSIEGNIQDFCPLSRFGHGVESFTLKGVYFEYSEYSLNYYFDNPKEFGGPIVKNRQYLKIDYYRDKGGNNRIVTLKIKKEDVKSEGARTSN